jgi:hypothetical protein
MTADATAAKVRLLQALKGSDQAEIPALVKTLEMQQAQGDLATLAGTWQLRWTSGTRQSQQWQRGLWMKGTPSSPPGVVYQRIPPDPTYLETIAAWGPLYLTVAGPFTYEADRHRLAFTFTKTVLGWGKLPALTIPMGNWAKGWLQTTYLDGDLHIERGDRGGISVYTRCSEGIEVFPHPLGQRVSGSTPKARN